MSDPWIVMAVFEFVMALTIVVGAAIYLYVTE